MKTKTIYICELCGKEYDNEKSAINCEHSHISVLDSHQIRISNTPNDGLFKRLSKPLKPSTKDKKQEYDDHHTMIIGSRCG